MSPCTMRVEPRELQPALKPLVSIYMPHAVFNNGRGTETWKVNSMQDNDYTEYAENFEPTLILDELHDDVRGERDYLRRLGFDTDGMSDREIRNEALKQRAIEDADWDAYEADQYAASSVFA